MSSTGTNKKAAVPKFASFKPRPEDEGGRASVPKFASFKKSDDSGAKPASPEERLLEDRHRRDPHHGRDRSRHTKSSFHHSHHHHDRQRSRSVERASLGSKPTAPQEDPIFITDKRGDPLIVRYGSNDRSKVPAYRRFGAGYILGAEGRIRVVNDGSKELFSLGNSSREGVSAFRDMSLLSKVHRTKPRLFKFDAKPLVPQEGHENGGFISLSTHSSKRKREYDNDGEELRDEKTSYRSLKGKATASDFADSDLESDDSSSSEADATTRELDPVKQKSIELSRRIKDNPEDMKAWIGLVDLQEELQRLDYDRPGDRTNEERKGLAALRVSLLEEALPHAQESAQREDILLRLMREGSRVWSSRVQAKRWTEMSGSDANFPLWKARLNFELTDLANFTYDKLKQVQLDRIGLLKQRLSERVQFCKEHLGDDESAHTSWTKDESILRICHELLHVFLRTTRFIHDAGYTELAIAAWQAILELSFARPDSECQAISEELLSSFGDFWESEVPRIGEDNARGWRFFTEFQGEAPEAKTGTPSTRSETRDVYKAWASAEKLRSRAGNFPARTLDEGTEEDPYRVVMFSDLEPLLFYIPAAIMPSVRDELLDLFLLFCRLPPASRCLSDATLSAYNDPYIDNGTMELGPAERGGGQEPEDPSKKPPKFDCDGRRMAVDPSVLFSGSAWFRYLPKHSSIAYYDIALNVTKQLGHLRPSLSGREPGIEMEFEQFAQYGVALACNKDPRSTRKTAKAMLKQYPRSGSLYNAYALAEWSNGSREVALTVLSSATKQSGLTEVEQLWCTWVWMELESGDKQRALARLVQSATKQAGDETDHVDPSSLSPSQLLKARHVFQDGRDFSVSGTRDMDRPAGCAESLALLEYLTAEEGTEPMSLTQGNISAAMESIHTSTATYALSRSGDKPPALERLLQSASRLLYHHASRGPFRPGYLREQLHGFIALFPRNTVFLRLYAWAEPSLVLLDDPAREVLRTTVLAGAHDCVSSRVFAIAHEASVGTVHSARAAFERALDGDACRGSVGLWAAYVRFCRGSRELRPTAKDVFYRAIGHCPWSKELAMEAFTTLVADMESSELRAVFTTLTTTGLRVHVDLDEFSDE